MAYTISTAITLTPTMIIAMIMPIGQNPWLFASALSLGCVQIVLGLVQLFASTEYDIKGDKAKHFMFPIFWKRVMGDAIVSNLKKSNEEIILKLRAMSEKEKLDPEDFEYLAKMKKDKTSFELSIEKFNELNVSQIKVRQSYYVTERTTDIKDLDVNKMLEQALGRASQEDTNQFNYAITKANQDSLKTNEIDLGVFELPEKDNQRHELSQQNKLIIEDPYFQGLQEKNYNEIKSIFKGESSYAIQSALEFLSLAGDGKVDWVRIKEIMSANYKSVTDYDLFSKKIQAQTLKQLSHEEREAIVSKIENSRSPSATVSNNSANSAIESSIEKNALKQSNKKCIFVNFNSALFAPEWAGIKEQYEIFFNLKDQHPPERYLEINSYLNTMLPMLIKAEEAMSKMHTSTNMSDEAQLMSHNLKLVRQRVENLNLEAKFSINRDLSVAQAYHNKTMSMGKS